MTDTANLGLPCIDAAQAQKHVTHNEALRLLDSLVQLAVLDRDLAAPPGSPAEGERWIVKNAGPTGAWTGHGDHVAAWQDGAWQFSIPKIGWSAYVVDENTQLTWNGTAWVLGFAAASQANAEAGTSDAVVMTALKVAQAIVALTQTFKNLVGRNGGMEVWQRGAGGSASFAVAASVTKYTVDGWYLKTGANQASVVAQTAGLTAASRWCAKVQRNAGQTGTGTIYFAFPLDADEVVKLRDKTLVLSFRTATGANWSPASGTLSYKLYCGTGTAAKRNASAYAGETNPLSGSVNLAQGAAAALNISALSAAVGASVTQAELQFVWSPVGTAGANDWIEIDDVQLEAIADGVAPATIAFERAPFETELARCQRHYSKSFPYGTAPADNATSTRHALFSWSTNGLDSNHISYPVTMRITPTLTFWQSVTGVAGTNGQWQVYNADGTWQSSTAISAQTQNDEGFVAELTTGSVVTIKAAFIGYGFWEADAGI